jgi:peptidyl-prolyl cis-trans isomerase-like 1
VRRDAQHIMATQVELLTTLGPITLELYTQHAPRACHNFTELTRRGYYDGCRVHRLVPGFILQSGDPTGTGRGGESVYGGAFEDETSRELKHTGAGILSMANAGPHTNRSQFFITLAPAPSLDGKHTIFGRVCAGMEVVRKISLVPTRDDKPLDPLVIVSATVKGGGS